MSKKGPKSLMLGLVLLISGCVNAAGVRTLGVTVLPDGSIRQYVQIEGDSNFFTPKVMAVEAFRCDRSKPCEKDGSYYAASPSVGSDLLKGVGSSAVMAGGIIGGAAILRPPENKTTVNSSAGASSFQYQGW
ncbi:MAG: hypothetical protein Q8Q46_00510 [Candidatus Giovannonibacteria bacterium]|nr:hypothetical protein [Candidatus Giovannonibacteria bacterium]